MPSTYRVLQAVTEHRAPPRCRPWGRPITPPRRRPRGRPIAPPRRRPWGRPIAPLRRRPWGRPIAPPRRRPWGRPIAPPRRRPWGRPIAPPRRRPWGRPIAPPRRRPWGRPIAPPLRWLRRGIGSITPRFSGESLLPELAAIAAFLALIWLGIGIALDREHRTCRGRRRPGQQQSRPRLRGKHPPHHRPDRPDPAQRTCLLRSGGPALQLRRLGPRPGAARYG